MTVLSDGTLRELVENGSLVIEPQPDPTQYQPASIDLTVSDDFIDLKHNYKVLSNSEGYDIYPGDFILASTLEYIEVPRDMVARVEGRSSYGRLGLMVHVTAGFIDPGFKGTITLEIKNISKNMIRLNKGDRICQLVLEKLDKPAQSPYNGHYQGQRQTKESIKQGF